jgi:hypothetical protein
MGLKRGRRQHRGSPSKGSRRGRLLVTFRRPKRYAGVGRLQREAG